MYICTIELLTNTSIPYIIIITFRTYTDIYTGNMHIIPYTSSKFGHNLYEA